MMDREKTEILFTFDTEDFTSPTNADSVLALTNLLSEEGVTGHFPVVGLVAERLMNDGRTDTIEGLKRHLIGCHSYRHSIHPNLIEIADKESFQDAYEETARLEDLGLECLKTVFGKRDILFAVPPGNSMSYVAMYYYAQKGIPFYLGGLLNNPAGDLNSYAGISHIPYYCSNLEEMLMPGCENPKSIDELLDDLSKLRRTMLNHHPNMGVKTTFWDGLNYNGCNARNFGNWIDAPARPLRDTLTFWKNLRELIRRLKADDRFVITDMKSMLKKRNECLAPAITRANLPGLVAELEKKLGPTASAAYCVSDIFYALAEQLNGIKSYTPGIAKGFLYAPQGITESMTVSASGIRQAASGIKTGEFIPNTILVDGKQLGPADFLFAMADVLLNDKNTISLAPRPQSVDTSELEYLGILEFKHQWLNAPDFKDNFMLSRLKMQNWTWRNFSA